MISTEITVRFNDCDSLGHVNNAVYYTYFEEGKRAIFELFNPNLNFDEWNIIVASTHCDYIQEIKYGETVTVLTWIGRLGRSSFDAEHAIIDKNGECRARGRVTLLGFDFISRESVPLSDSIRQHLEKHMDQPKNVPDLRSIK
ncbi:acyl-CoA thioesterase [Terrilactibacillus sp. BCM23-1]|uniref:Acyl-CoA thioesterase n=1 Tax=Terrilactibacillus tamarindi TaxID=2599694 RepID=A0A6N8CLS3_9BACI|nr:acyl-CoA thioesterase [Terrilactibacillus tamarindi]MTT30781.1 acyl-CoA thioesterase [Terrilactibacillus tamarindi]